MFCIYTDAALEIRLWDKYHCHFPLWSYIIPIRQNRIMGTCLVFSPYCTTPADCYHMISCCSTLCGHQIIPLTYMVHMRRFQMWSAASMLDRSEGFLYFSCKRVCHSHRYRFLHTPTTFIGAVIQLVGFPIEIWVYTAYLYPYRL